MKIAIVGTGYVGLVTGTCFAESGNDVVCVDNNQGKIISLNSSIVPIHEPGLQELVSHNREVGRLRFSTDLKNSIDDCPIIFICVGTPQNENGSADLSALWDVIDSIQLYAKAIKIIVIKSTVPVGTNALACKRVNVGTIKYRVVSNPEFLKEGCAIEDFTKPDRVVVGTHDTASIDLLRELYSPYLRTNHPFVVMSPESAEMTKLVANCFLATKISFINEMANLSERLGADINEVREGIGHDNRIGFQFLHPGPGYGGSCFPKDVQSLIQLSKKEHVPSLVMQAVDGANERQKELLFAKLAGLFDGDFTDKTIAIWGLSFKPNTDDIRRAPSLRLINRLLAVGVKAKVYDPVVRKNTQRLYGLQIEQHTNAYNAVKGADALVIVTEWQEFHNPCFAALRKSMRGRVIVDGRNLYDPEHVAKQGFTYASIGRQTVQAKGTE